MRHFFKDALEPLSYLMYSISILVLLRRIRSFKNVVLFIYYGFTTIGLIYATYTGSDSTNTLIYNIFFLITIGVFSYYYRLVLLKKIPKMIVTCLFFVNLLLFIQYNIFLSQLYEINTLVYSVTFLSMVIYALFYFEQVLSTVSELNILKQFDFWLISGQLLYFLSAFFIIVFYVNIEISQRALLWSLQNVILFLSAGLTLSGSLWIASQRT